MLPHLRPGLGMGFGGNHNLVSDAREGISQLLFAIGVSPGSIEIVHSAVYRFPQQIGSLLFADPLNGQTAKPIFLNSNTSGT